MFECNSADSGGYGSKT